MRPSALQARPLETMRPSTTAVQAVASGSSRYSAAIGRASCSSSIVPAKNRPSGDTLPSLNRVPGTRSGPARKRQRAGVEVQQVEAVDQGHDGAARRRGGRTTRSATASARCGRRPSPGRGGAARARGCPPSTAPARAPTRPGTRPARRGRRARTPRRSSRARRQLGLQLLQHPAVDGVGVFLPAEHAHRGDPVERRVAQGREELVPVQSPLPISLCWWIRASTPGGLMM